MKKIYVFGSLNTDLVINAPRELKNGETVRGSGFMINCGGKGANQAVACGKLGGDVKMGGGVGSDDFGKRLIEVLRSYNVDTDGLKVFDGVPSGVAVITVTDGDNRIILDGGANHSVGEAEADAFLESAEAGDIFLTQLENRTEIAGYALKKAKEKGLITVLNPAPMDKAVAPYIKYVDILMPNMHEFYDLTGSDCIRDGLEELLKMGAKHIVVTLGSQGYCFCSGNEIVYEDCIHAEVVDTTAAGDTFCGAFVTRLSAGDGIPEALRFANKAASVTVGRRGAQQSIPTLKEMKTLFGV